MKRSRTASKSDQRPSYGERGSPSPENEARAAPRCRHNSETKEDSLVLPRRLAALSVIGGVAAFSTKACAQQSPDDASVVRAVSSVSKLARVDPKAGVALVEDPVRGGLFAWRPDETRDDKVVFVKSRGADGSWARLYEGGVNAKWFGFDVDEEATTNSTALQEALDYAAASEETLFIEPGEYALKKGVVIDAARTRVVGGQSHLRFAALTSGAAITLTGSEAFNHFQMDRFLSGLYIHGPGQTTNTIGVAFVAGEAGGESGAARFKLRDCFVRHFGEGVKFGGQAFLNDLQDTYITRCRVGVSFFEKSPNAFEKMGFQNCVLAENEIAVEANCSFNELIFSNCSFDFNGKVAAIETGHLQLLGCHIEFNGNQGDYAVDLGVNGGGNLSWTMIGGKVQVNWTDENTLQSLVRNDADPGYVGAVFENVVFFGIRTETGYFSTGRGRTRISNSKRFPNPGASGVLLSQNQNMIRNPDGDRDKPSALRIDASSGEVSLDFNPAQGGGYRLTMGAGSSCSITVAAPCHSGQFLDGRFLRRLISGVAPEMVQSFAFAERPDADSSERDFLFRFAAKFTSEDDDWRSLDLTPEGYNYETPGWANTVVIGFDLAAEASCVVGIRALILNSI